MHRWCVLLLCLTLLGALAFIAGCDGEDGIQGEKGETGPVGPAGYDGSILAPADKYVSIGITNATVNAVAGAKNVQVSFDSTAVVDRNTIQANYVNEPPLIDGIDGDEGEWGPLFKKVPLDYYNLDQDTTLEDPNILEVFCRAAYDEENIYMLLSWREVTISVKTASGGDSILVLASISGELNELKLDVPHPSVDTLPSGEVDTTFKYLRTFEKLDSIVVFCFPPPPAPPVYCETLKYVGIDTTLVWIPSGKGEDRVGVIWSDEDNGVWADDAFDLLFRSDGYQPSLSADEFLDVWLWGAATSWPVSTADDYFIDSRGLLTDAGAPPFLNNLVLPDSIPRYQNVRDPNIRTGLTPGNAIYPLWYYELVGYKRSGWLLTKDAYAPGIVTTIPSGSRADVYSTATFDNGVYVLELKRPRKTHSGDDLIF